LYLEEVGPDPYQRVGSAQNKNFPALDHRQEGELGFGYMEGEGGRPQAVAEAR
jgi:hypothetical protein